jgi:hypothetical protein
VRGPRATAIQREVARRQGSPYTGKLFARPAGKPGDFFIVKEEFATIPSSPLGSRSHRNTEAPQYAFLRHGGIYLVRWGFKNQTKPWVKTEPPPAGRPRAQVKERVGRTTLLLIVRR